MTSKISFGLNKAIIGLMHIHLFTEYVETVILVLPINQEPTAQKLTNQMNSRQLSVALHNISVIWNGKWIVRNHKNQINSIWDTYQEAEDRWAKLLKETKQTLLIN